MFLSDTQVADRYGVSRATPWRWARKNPMFPKPIEISKGCKRWRKEDLEKFEQEASASDTLKMAADIANDHAENASQDHEHP